MAQGQELTGIKACVFDAYGTLFDVHSAVGRHRERLGAKAGEVSATWRTKQLEYTWLRSLMGRWVEFWQVTGEALEYALEAAGVEDEPLREDLMSAYLSLEAYPEVPGVLKALQAGGMRTAILSNGSRRMLDAGVESAGIGGSLDAVLSVDDVGVFKPDPRVYRMAVDGLGVEARAIAFMSSNAWDAAGAATYGFQVAWVNRFGQTPERLPDGPAAEIVSLEALPSMVLAT